MRRLFPLPDWLEAENEEALAFEDLPEGEPWGFALARAVLADRATARRLLTPSPGLRKLVAERLSALREKRTRLVSKKPVPPLGSRPASAAEAAALAAIEAEDPLALAEVFRQHGPRPFNERPAYRFDGDLTPIEHPDLPSVEALVGYERQLERLTRLAQRFLAGKPPPPTLLYGARGTGKSTAVKALLTRFGDAGLRLVEVEPRALGRLAELFLAIEPWPQRFLLFLDDLAFDADDAEYRELKSLLDGAAFAHPKNVWVVATSNRRNLIKEAWADRETPHAFDQQQEALSFADRFGVVLTFPPFDKARYLEAVARHLGRPLDAETEARALAFAREGRGFSGRTARHFAQVFG